YSLNTSTTTLRGHIKKHHLDVYLTLAKARGWNTLLVVKGQSQTSDSVASGAAQGDNREEFTEETFRRHLLKFIVVDDQDSMIPRRSKTSELLLVAWRLEFHQLNRELATGHFTLDGASNNGTMLAELQRQLNDREIAFDAYDRRMMCFAHIIDLSAKRVINGLNGTESDYQNWNHSPFPSDPDTQTYEEALARKPVSLARTVAQAMRKSGARREAFAKVIDDGNAQGWFKVRGVVVQVKQMELLCEAVDYFLTFPTGNVDLSKYRISPKEWDVLQDVEYVLSKPHRVQQIMSKETTPVLSGAIPAFETFMTSWERLVENYPHLQFMVQPGLDLMYKYYTRMDRTKAYVLAMFLNPSIRMSWINKHWSAEYIKDAKNTILDTVSTL
ncbi:hypothetical protein EDB84DRAFT_1277499, partial [Lactarius hengduanensis]